METDIPAVADRLSFHAEAVCQQLLPSGHKEGHAWKCGDVLNNPGNSLTVELSPPNQGKWFDHATSEGGGILKLVMLNRGVEAPQAADWARAFMGEPPWQPNGQGSPRPMFDPMRDLVGWVAAVNARIPPTTVHAYRYPNGKPPDYVARYEFESTRDDGSRFIDKVTLPWRCAPEGWVNKKGEPIPAGTYVQRGWKKDQNEPRPIYGLDLLACDPSRNVLIVEGEKTADAARRLFTDLTVITWQGGSKSVRFVDWSPLQTVTGKLVIWPDNDDSGRSAAFYLKSRFPHLAVVRIPDSIPANWDLADPAPADLDPRGVIDAALNPPPLSPAPDADTPSIVPPDSDAARSDIIVSRFQSILRYVHPWKRWLVFESTDNHPPRWNKRDDGGLIRHARLLSSELYARAVASFEPSLIKLSTKFADATKVRNAAAFAQADPRVIILPSQVDHDPWVLGCPNGFIDLKTGLLHPHDTSHVITKSTRCNYDPHADCPLWMRFLEKMVPDPSVRLYLQKFIGYSITGETSEQIFAFLFGKGANGKTTFIETIYALMGNYALKAPDRLIHMDDRGTTPPDVIAAIDGIRFLVGPETVEGAKLNEGPIKDLAGSDTMHGARKYEHGYDFNPVAKLWCFGNHRPAIRGTDDGIWRKIRLIHFPVQIPVAERDPDLKSKLLMELPGILAWAVDGCLAWQRERLQVPASIANDTNQYRTDEDVLGEFIDSHTLPCPGSKLPMSDLFKAYKSWADSSGIRAQLTNRSLANKLRDRGWSQNRNNSLRFWSDVMLTPPPTNL